MISQDFANQLQFMLTSKYLGDRFAYVDIKGTLAIMGVGENRVAKTSQEQQFFSNDYE